MSFPLGTYTSMAGWLNGGDLSPEEEGLVFWGVIEDKERAGCVWGCFGGRCFGYRCGEETPGRSLQSPFRLRALRGGRARGRLGRAPRGMRMKPGWVKGGAR